MLSRRCGKLLVALVHGPSGSTLLQKILATIPGCHFNGENCDALMRWPAFTLHSQCKYGQRGAGPNREKILATLGVELI
jgi:hypothetical protein